MRSKLAGNQLYMQGFVAAGSKGVVGWGLAVARRAAIARCSMQGAPAGATWVRAQNALKRAQSAVKRAGQTHPSGGGSAPAGDRGGKALGEPKRDERQLWELGACKS